MHKRFLAIFAIVATIFAFGVGSALAQKPADPGPPDGPPPACEKDDAPDWCEDYDGQPGDRDGDDGGDDGDDDGDDEGDEGDEGPGPQDLCDAIRSLDPNLAPIADGCDAIVAALTGGGGEEEPPAEEPPADEEPPAGERPAPCGEFDQIPEVGGQFADGCEQVVGALGGGGEEPPAEEPPADEEPPAGERPAPCGEFDQIPEVGGQLADGCEQVVGALPLP